MPKNWFLPATWLTIIFCMPLPPQLFTNVWVQAAPYPIISIINELAILNNRSFLHPHWRQQRGLILVNLMPASKIHFICFSYFSSNGANQCIQQLVPRPMASDVRHVRLLQELVVLKTEFIHESHVVSNLFVVNF